MRKAMAYLLPEDKRNEFADKSQFVIVNADAEESEDYLAKP